jgi:hypothetical protein
MVREEFMEFSIGVFVVDKRYQYGPNDTAHRSGNNL